MTSSIVRERIGREGRAHEGGNEKGPRFASASLAFLVVYKGHYPSPQNCTEEGRGRSNELTAMEQSVVISPFFLTLTMAQFTKRQHLGNTPKK